MALTLTEVLRGRIDNAYLTIYTATWDNSYPTGGEALTANNVGLTTVSAMIPVPSSGFTYQYDASNAKLIAYYADYSTTTDGALIQVADTASDLDAVVTTLVSIGF